MPTESGLSNAVRVVRFQLAKSSNSTSVPFGYGEIGGITQAVHDFGLLASVDRNSPNRCRRSGSLGVVEPLAVDRFLRVRTALRRQARHSPSVERDAVNLIAAPSAYRSEWGFQELKAMARPFGDHRGFAV
jgi:hypothetical protein